MKKAIILGVVLIFTSLHLFAQDDDTIKVRTKRDALDPSTTSLATTIITSDEIEAMGADNVAEVLENVVGVQVRNSQGESVVYIRGASINQTLVLVNGVKQNLAQGLPPNMALYSTGNIERIEIIRGAAATRYGSGAIGGVINIITKDRVDSVTGAEVRIKYGSYNAVTADVFGNITFGKNNQANVFLSGSITTNSRNFDFEGRDENGKSVISGEMKNNEILTGNAMLGFGYRFNEEGDKINASLSAMYEDRNSPGSYYNPWVSAVGFENPWNFVTQRYGAEVSYEHYSLPIFNFKVTAATFYDIKDNNSKTYGTNHFTNSSSILSASFDREDKFGDVFTFYNQLNFSYGFEHFVDSRDSKQFEDGHTVNRQTISIAYLPELGFLNYEGTDVSRITILPAIRFDSIIGNGGATKDNNYNEPTYSLGLMYTFDTERRYIVKGNFGTSFRVPTFNDLYWAEQGNPNLKKESAISGDIGFAVQPINMIRLEALYYVSSIDDMIVWGVAPGETLSKPSNIESALLQGIESTVALLVPIKPINSNIEVSVNYLYQFGKGIQETSTLKLEDKKLPFTPEHSVGSMLSYIYDGNDVLTRGRLNFLVNYVGERYSDIANKVVLDEYVTLDITASVTFIDIVTLEGGVKNVLDERYESARYFAEPGREFYIALSGRI